MKVHIATPLMSSLVGAVIAWSCGGVSRTELTGELALEERRPTLESMPAPPPEYTGTNPYVMEAATNHRTPLDLHRNVVLRTCGPTGGVCHNQKEYPDLHTPANLIRALNAPCNIQPADYTAVFDGCERAGDRLTFGDGETQIEIGYVDYVPGEADAFNDAGGDANATTPGLHIVLHDPIGGERNDRWGSVRFHRTFVNDAGEVQELSYARFETQWRVIDGGKHLIGRVQNYQADTVTNLMSVGIEQGDRNRNGNYGAQLGQPLSLLVPGQPESSYLIGRMRGVIGDQEIPGTRMPLANTPWSIPDMLAFFCFVEGISGDPNMVPDLESPIDYVNCSYTADPESLNLLGQGVTWRGRVQPFLESNCGGCHGGTAPQGELDLVSEGAYERLLGPSVQKPDVPLIAPSDPDGSYLFQKILGSEGIVGAIMPLDPLAVDRTLPEAAIADIRTWIENGALQED